MRGVVFSLVFLVACGTKSGTSERPIARSLESYFPLASVGEPELCSALEKRTETDRAGSDKPRRKVIISDLHLGPGTSQGRQFDGLDDFFADDAFERLLARLSARPTELIVAGDFIEFWQIEEAMSLLDNKQENGKPILGADSTSALAALDVAIAAHPKVFAALSSFLRVGDNRVVFVVGNHDGDLIFPRVQLAIARALAQKDLTRLAFVTDAYVDRGVHVEHGHLTDPANKVGKPVMLDGGRCRLVASWGQVFVAKFFGELEQKFPFVDNLYPESSALLWGVKGEPDVTAPILAGYRFIDMLLSEQSGELNLEALRAAALSVLGAPDSREGGDWGSMWDRMPTSDAFWSGFEALATDAKFKPLRDKLILAAAALPDLGAAREALADVDVSLLGELKDEITRDPLEVAATELINADPSISVVVIGHTHVSGGKVAPIEGGHYANSGTWTPIAEIAALKKRGIKWPDLKLSSRDQFPLKLPAVVIDYAGDKPRPPHIIFAE